jgi:hypothetical protein
MAKLTLTDVTTGYSSATRINANNDLIEAALENTLSRDGTSPNTMSANLDMNSNRITNLAPPASGYDGVRQADIAEFGSGTYAGDNTFSGENTFSNTVTFTGPVVATGGNTIATPNLLLSGVTPAIQFYETGTTADYRNWSFYPFGSSFYGRIDDDAFSVNNAWIQVTRNGSTVSSVSFPTATGGSLLFGTQSRIDDIGNSLVNVLAPTGIHAQTIKTVTHNTYPAILWNSDTSNDNTFVYFATETSPTGRGNITFNRGGGLVAYNTTSDYRAKDVYGPVENPGETVDALTVYRGKMHGATQERPMLIAHETQAVAPYAVTGEKDAVNEDGSPKYQQMDVSALVPLLIAEIQELRARVAALEVV